MEKRQGLSSWVWIAIVGLVFTFSAIFIRLNANNWINPNKDLSMNENQARLIATSSCIKGSETLESGYYNSETKTWWFDANLNATQPGCNPACVVSGITKTAEINWRCTGLIPDENLINSFEDCVNAGLPIMESYPRQCRANGKTFVEEIDNDLTSINCTPEQRNVDMCAMVYQPVCAEVEIRCIQAPCEPIKQTFGNSCEACKNSLVKSYVEGPCSESYRTLESIRDLFIEKYPEKKSSFIIKIDDERDNHARGSVSFQVNTEGGLWLAVKQNQAWKLVYDGNGSVDCPDLFARYNFPIDMLNGICD